MKYLFNVGDKVDNFTLLEHIRIETAAGNKEWRWKCIDETGMFYYMRPRALHLKAQKAQKAIDRIVNTFPSPLFIPCGSFNSNNLKNLIT